MTGTMMDAVYIHIPFCQQLCHYCDFVKFMYTEEMADQYVEALKKEIDHTLPGKGHKMKTIYIGGGTPTALNRQQLTDILSFLEAKFDMDHVEEYSIELNPGDLEDETKAEILKKHRINRISFGVQVMDDAMLKQLGRLHRVKDVYHTIDILRKNDFSNISLDLIYALPNQTVEQFRESLEEALALDLPHYATYGLQIEPRTPFYKLYKKGKLPRPAEEEEVEMYEILKQSMQAKGIEQYEISNFAKQGFESKHNKVYWNNDYYYGFGVGAHGYLPGKRIANIRVLPQYIRSVLETGSAIDSTEAVTIKERIEEEMFLGIRKVEGVQKQKFQDRFGIKVESLYESALRQLSSKGLVKENETRIQLTEEGKLLGNIVSESFLLDDEAVIQKEQAKLFDKQSTF